MPDLTTLLTDLNEPQREAVEALDGPLLVLAGAGTGKTKVLTTRLANLIASGKAQPHNILAVTFTNKAAKEMASRVEHILGTSTAGMWLGTFHALGARFLRMHAERVGLQPDFTILDTDDQKRLIDQILKERNLDTSRFPPRLVASVISRWKDNAWTPGDVPADEGEAVNGQGIALYGEYQRRLLALNACDFGDLLLHMLVLFRDHQDILSKYQNQLRYVLVDEYQDTNAVQYLWLRLLTMEHKNICVVGDDDQSIYAWRGAQVGNILKFEKDFVGAKVVRLEQNYRSTGQILQAASELISHNRERHGKTLWTNDGDGEAVELHPVADDHEEARMVADRVESHLSSGLTYNHHAVLVRTAAQTRSFEERFVQSGVPYIVVGGLKFYERKEIRDAIAYLRLIANPRDDLAFNRIINVPKRGVGNAAMQTLEAAARSQNLPLLAAAEYCVERQEFSGKALNNIRQFVEHMQRWQQSVDTTTPDALVENVLEDAGYSEMLRNDKDPDAKTRLDNLKELMRAMQEYPDLQSFLEHVSLVMDEESTSDDAVKLMTVHAAKGLEFDTVFLPGFEDGLFPHQRSLNEEGMKGVEEERRLAYVAMTRARRQLILSYTSARRMYGQFQPSVASRFLQEIPDSCLKTVASTNTYSSYRPAWGSRMDQRAVSDYAKPAEPLMPYTNTNQATDYPIGSRIFHQKFGYGRIHRTEGNGEQERLVINFDKAGQKTLMAALAKIERV